MLNLMRLILPHMPLCDCIASSVLYCSVRMGGRFDNNILHARDKAEGSFDNWLLFECNRISDESTETHKYRWRQA